MGKENNIVLLKARLDITGSLPNIKLQVDEITKKLENKPVKLKVKLDATIKDLQPQINAISLKLENKPIKLKVDIDVQGSATKIKKQLQEIYKVVGDFNKKYGESMKKIQEYTAKATTIPTNAGLGDLKIKQYVSQLKQAENSLKSAFGKGLFGSNELKDAEGNLHGFVASLEKANGVVQKVRYSWNKKSGSFEVVDQQTITNTEKATQRALNSLKELDREIMKLGKDGNKFWTDYNRLQNSGNITQNAVNDLKTRIKDEQVLQQQIGKENDFLRQQAQLLENIKRASKKDKRDNSAQYGDLLGQTRNAQNPNDIKDINAELEKLKYSTKEYNTKVKESNMISQKRAEIMKQLNAIERTTYEMNGALSRQNIERVQQDAQNIRSAKQLMEVQKQLALMNKQKQSIKLDSQAETQLNKLKKLVYDVTQANGNSVKSAEGTFDRLSRNVGKNIGSINTQIKAYQRLLDGVNYKKMVEQEELLKRQTVNISSQQHNNFWKMVTQDEQKAITEVKEYIGQLNKAKVSMASIDSSNGKFTITAQLASAGKEARKLTYEIDNVNRQLRLVRTQDVYNANRNLGVFEQLKVAMARIPVWMAGMTAFYGSIRTVKAMTDQILQLDEALTQIRRVASSNLSIDTLFKGAVNLSSELGNNVHDILDSLAEFARTFGDFNERQLLAITKTATLMSNVSDLTPQEATQDLVGTMNAFNISAEDSIHIVDALNQVDNDYAVSTKQLADGLSKSSSVAKTFGVTMEENIGHITAIGSVTMESGDVIGNSLKTIYSRITTMNQAKGVLEGVGIAISHIGKNGEETVRPVNDILGQLAMKWDRLSDATKQNIAVNVAGRYQLARFLALMNNYDTALKATDTATYSQGSAIRENEKYMQSYEARINKLKNGFTELANAVGDSFLKGGILVVIDALGALAKGATVVAQHFGALPTVLLAVSLVMLKMGVFSGTIGNVVASFKLFRSELVRTSATATTFGARMGAVRTSMGAFSALMPTVTGLVKGFWKVLGGIGSSLIIGAIFVGIGVIIEKFISHYQKLKQTQEEVDKVNNQMISAFRASGDGLQGLVNRYDELRNKTSLSNKEQAEFNRLQKELVQDLPTVVQSVDASGKAHLKNTDVIKKEIERVKELSELQAKSTEQNYNKNVGKQAQSILDANKKIANAQKEADRLDKEKLAQASGYGDNTSFQDNSQAISANKIEALKAEADKTEAIKKTMKVIQDQTFAYLEANHKLSALGDTQQKAVENFITQNQQYIDSAKTPEELSKGMDDLYNIGQKVGETFAQAFNKLSAGIGNNPKKIEELKVQLSSVASALPESFFKIDENKGRGIDVVTQQLQGVIDVSSKIAHGSKDFEGLKHSLQTTGLTADEAGGYIVNLANANNNAELKTLALKQGAEELSGALQDQAEATLKAVDAMATLFGYSNEDVQAMRSHIDTMLVMKKLYGDNAKLTDAWGSSEDALAKYFNVTGKEVDKNLIYYSQAVGVLEKVKIEHDKLGNVIFNTKELTKSELAIWQKLNKEGKNGFVYDLLVKSHQKLAKEIDKSAKKTKEHSKATDESKKKNNELKKSIDDINKSTSAKPISPFDGVGSNAKKNKKPVDDIKKSIDKVNNTINKPHPIFDGVGSNAEKNKKPVENIKKSIDNITHITAKPISPFDSVGSNAEKNKKPVDDLKKSYNELYQTTAKPIPDSVNTGGSIKKKESEVNSLVSAIKKATSSADLISKLNSMLGSSADSATSLTHNLQNMATIFSGMIDSSTTASTKIKKALDSQKASLAGLEGAYAKKVVEIVGLFTSLATTIKVRTTSMINQHDKQKNAIDKLVVSARIARDAIADMNDSARNAMDNLDTYITKAKLASSSGHSVPILSSSSAIATSGQTNFMSPSVISAVNSFSALAGESLGGSSSSSDGGTSGTIQPSIYDSGIDIDGTYKFRALATRKKATKPKPDPPADPYNIDAFGRTEQKYQTYIGQLQAKLDGLNQTSLKYRDTLKSLISYENLYLSTIKKDLSATEARNKAILKTLSKLPPLSRQNAKQRDQYNSLQQEYDKNLGDIASLKSEIQNMANTVKQQSEQIFSDFIDEIVTKYDTAINKIKSKIDDIDFKINVLDLTNPDDIKNKINLMIQKAKEQTNEMGQDKNKVNDFQAKYRSAVEKYDNGGSKDVKKAKADYDKAVKKYGKNSSQAKKELADYDAVLAKYTASSAQAKKVKEQLDQAKKDLQDITLGVLETEKSIKDVRGEIADKAIEQLKDYYGKMKDMALSAIDAEEKALSDAHDTKMKMLDDEADKINKNYDVKMNEIDKTKAVDDYNAQLAEKTKTRDDLTQKVAMYSGDTSVEGKKKLAEYQKQLDDANKDVQSLMRDHNDQVKKDKLDSDKQTALDSVQAKKDTEDEAYKTATDALEKQKVEISKFYDDIINNDKDWADKRNEFIKGNFKVFDGALADMKTNLKDLDSGTFDELTKGFAGFSTDVQKQITDMSSMLINDLLFSLTKVTDGIKQMESTDTYKVTKGKGKNTQSPPSSTKETTSPSKPSSGGGSKSSGGSSSSGGSKKTAHGWKTTGSLNLRSSATYNGKVIEVMPKDAVVEYLGMVDGWAKIKYKGKTGYAGKSYLKQFKSGGFTGDWSGEQGKLAILDKKELVLNEKQTSDILDTAKIINKISNVLPTLKRNMVANTLASSGTIITNNYDLTVNIANLNGTKEQAKTVVKEIITGLKKMGK